MLNPNEVYGNGFGTYESESLLDSEDFVPEIATPQETVKSQNNSMEVLV